MKIKEPDKYNYEKRKKLNVRKNINEYNLSYSCNMVPLNGISLNRNNLPSSFHRTYFMINYDSFC